MLRWFLKHIFLSASVFILWALPADASDTMLLFVGENLDVLSIASGREEAAWKAPAAADVINKNDFEMYSFSTVSDTLSSTAGIHAKDYGSDPDVYMRGIPGSALFLYDTVPIGSGIAKSGSFLNGDISLVSLKRIEIIRGSGSVLWGPDAFAGVVNYVPLTGRDFHGSQTGTAFHSADKGKEVYFRHGRESDNTASFLSLSYKMSENKDIGCNVKNFFNGENSPAPPEQRFGNTYPDDSQQMEFHYNGEIKNLISCSLNLGRNEKGFAMSDFHGDYVWPEKKTLTSGSVKLEGKKDISFSSSLRFTGYYSALDTDYEVIDKQFSSFEDSVFGEVVYSKECFSYSGIFTAGTSFRRNEYKDIPVWESYIAGYFIEENTSFLPGYNEAGYTNTLVSGFVQYHHNFSFAEIWAGLRHDNHKQYEDRISGSTGITIPFKNSFVIKGIYGTAYRTPFAKQFLLRGGKELEEITGLTVQFQWKPEQNRQICLTGFSNKIANHVTSDRYEGAGLSLPNSQTINGLELEATWKINDGLTLDADVTKLFVSGHDEAYDYYDHSINGEPQSPQRRSHEYDAGPELYTSASAVIKLTDKINLIPKVSYFSERRSFYFKDNSVKTYDSVFTTDLFLKADYNEKLSYTVFAENIFDKKYSGPGYSKDIKKGGINAGVRLSFKW